MPGGDYKVVINDEDQYSIWAANRPAPAGWREEGFSGDRNACLDYIDKVWTDMRPRSLREAMRELERAD
ncbi:MbtH family protein [Nonomuraea sp. 3N208]|uniref:MbtH family protein n=1 Tax=unclassified Nonomuraea TaxID=2593643 RepID=UPI00273C56FA|nr:MbtH family NRPS accessory protein [Nonomuraea sp. G32]MDP4501991.1 MbtH family NRPS accessory protein [Nonomuraea sp. G32]